MRKTIIAGNWKMYKTIKEGQELVNALNRELYNLQNLDIVVCPPYTLISCLADMLTESNISMGAQNLFWERSPQRCLRMPAANL
jgi:triosephosphate isomerase (TIM)